MLFFDFIQLINSEESLLTYLMENNVIKKSISCGKCNFSMNIQNNAKSIDKKCFRCTKCKTKKSIRTGSFVETLKLPLIKIACIVYFMNLSVQQKDIAEILDLDAKTVMDFQAMMREEYGKFLIRNGEKLGGQGVIVQVDESVIARAKRSRNGHARPVREQWVFGAYDIVQKLGWIELVPDRTRETLHRIIEEWCLPGTIIVSDGWSAYRGLNLLGFEHRVVIHEENFVDSITGVHTNNVEAYWQRCKRTFKRMYGTSRELIATHIDEFLWRERYGATFKNRWNNFFITMKRNYE